MNQRPPRNSALGFARTRDAHQTELAEDYVELIDELIRETGEARTVDISRRLGVSHVTVTKALMRLQDAGLVTSRPYRSNFLTEAGRSMASSCHARHESVLRFLVAIGVSENAAAIDAEGIEHHVSEATLAAMRRFVEKEDANAK
jgi:DtxR family transcriptional regulator, manganese transport regulator